YRCQDCLDFTMYCSGCILKGHIALPLHWIKCWNSRFCYFERSSLASIGLVIDLGHHGTQCEFTYEIRECVIVDTTGIHNVNVRLCSCGTAVEDPLQFLRVKWFPSSFKKPHTLFTFTVLDQFHSLTLQSKIAAYDFCVALEHLTDNSDCLTLQSCYEQFLLLMRIWCHLKITKRASCGLNPAGVEATAHGECAVECPVCPHPEKNLPEDRETMPKETRRICSLVLTIDANFCLRNKDWKIKRDFPLGDGWAHWVPSRPYLNHIKQYGYQQAPVCPNLCDSELRAVDHANKQRSDGYVATGVGGVVCAQHGLVRPNGMGDLQKGERYVNMDFIVLFTLMGATFTRLILSYDIACQWSQNLRERMDSQHTEAMQIPDEIFILICFVIPKFHIYGHGRACQDAYSLNNLCGVGQTNGEDPERWWAHINPVSMSTRLMGPGSQSDTIDDHTCAWNWRKIVGLHTCSFSSFPDTNRLLTRCRAFLLSAKHTALHARYSQNFPSEVRDEWEEWVGAWEDDRESQPNPYSRTIICSTMAEVRLELAQEEARDGAFGGEEDDERMCVNSFLYRGLELEEQQCVFLRNLCLRHPNQERTTLQAAELQEKRNTLSRRILSWCLVQNRYMPGIFTEARGQAQVELQSEEQTLFLPSHVTPAPRSISHLCAIEARLCVAQADDALTETRRLLRITLGLADYQWTQVSHGQGPRTRAHAVVDRYKAQLQLATEAYRMARKALVQLDPLGSWIGRLHELQDGDIRWPTREEGEVQGTRELSWIWLNVNPQEMQGTSEEIGDSLRVEWLRSHTRTARWSEEHILVIDEMNHVLCYLEWKSSSWTVRIGKRVAGPELDEGLKAYAVKSAMMFGDMKDCFRSHWSP
ncbi:hypothetical protein BDN71DRAFT_1343661, partial [Pleurotus eryngii]